MLSCGMLRHRESQTRDVRDAESTEFRRCEDKIRGAPFRTASADAERVLHPSCSEAASIGKDAPDGHSTLNREDKATAQCAADDFAEL